MLEIVVAGAGREEEKIAAMRALLQKAGSPAIIQVDGGLNAKTLPEARAAGADSFIMGSAVFGGDIRRNLQQLRQAAGMP